nr:DUF16 domain-containing protein [Mycoplasmoides pneumoniae]
MKRKISLTLFKKRLNKDKINNCHVWEEELPDGSYDMEFNGNLNHMEKRKSGYVTQKQFNEYKDSNDQRLIKIETTLAAQGEQISQLVQIVFLQGKQIKELQAEQKAQRVEFNARMDRFESLVLKSLESIGNTLTDFGKRLDSMETRLDSMDGRLDSMETRLDKIDPPK